MQYKEFMGKQISTLGMGNMRLPTTGGMMGPVDEDKARELIEYVYGQGVNYFDTAFPYHNGESERVLGKVMSRFPRESWYLADKFWYQSMQPGWSVGDFFEEQLSRCRTDYIDFYMIHNIGDQTIGDYLALDKTHGMLDYLREQKKAGRIRHLGFSCHSNNENMVRFLDYCGGDMEFVQIQLNYADWTFQDAKGKYEILRDRGIPVIVMEPVRGGRLASLGAEQDARLKAERPGDSVASWAFHFAQALPGVLTTLSGMSTIEQAADNIATFSAPKPLNEGEKALLQELVAPLLTQVPCTACKYCAEEEGCPKGLDIPGLIAQYNDYMFDPGPGIAMAAQGVPAEELPGACVACGRCVKACPQGIGIPDIMGKLQSAIDEGMKVFAGMQAPQDA